jgi:hypothetical protein
MSFIARTAGLAALVTCVGCAGLNPSPAPAPVPDNTPVGTTGTTPPTQPSQVSTSEPGVIPVGQELDVRLQTALSSATATAEQRFEATTAVGLLQGDRVLVPAGSTVRGVVQSAESAGRIDRTGRLTLAFDQITIEGRDYPMRALATQVYESKGIREEAGTVGAGAGVGAIVGGILGGLRGALLGAIVGGGGVIAATEGKDVELPSGTIIRLRLDTPVQVR